MQALEVFASQLPARIVAHYQPFGMGRLGEIAVDHSSIGQSLSAGLAILAHETSHAYQDALVMGLVTTSPEVAQDVAWFSIQKAREAVRPPELFIRSELRYLSLPTEIDAWTMQEDAEQKIGLRLGSNPI